MVSQEEAWSVVTRQANRLKNLANDILDVSRIDGGKLVLKKKEIDINTLVRNLAKVMILDKDLTLELRLEETKDVKVFADESRILQVVTNLINNSVKFTEKGTITIESKKLNGSKLMIFVRDTGPGIPAEVLPRLFTKFATKDVSESSKNGTGLGLYISKGIIEAHGGIIEGANAKEGGAEFKFVLPINSSNPAMSQVPELETKSR
jgi:signal transduction histidine kinase